MFRFISALKEHPGDPWIKKYIFPGEVIPSFREMRSCAAESDFHTVKRMFDERFVRMRDLYLCACAVTFHRGIIDLHQVLFTKGINIELPLAWWY